MTLRANPDKGTRLLSFRSRVPLSGYAALAEAAGVPCVFHCAHDLGLKTAAMLHVVASAPGFPLANDCTYYGLEDDILTPLHQIERGFMPVPEGPGLGVSVDEKKVAKDKVA